MPPSNRIRDDDRNSNSRERFTTVSNNYMSFARELEYVSIVTEDVSHTLPPTTRFKQTIRLQTVGNGSRQSNKYLHFAREIECVSLATEAGSQTLPSTTRIQTDDRTSNTNTLTYTTERFNAMSNDYLPFVCETECVSLTTVAGSSALPPLTHNQGDDRTSNKHTQTNNRTTIPGPTIESFAQQI